MLSTIENRIGNEVLNAKLTTPNPVEFLRILNDMVLSNCHYCFMEASSHAIHQKRILGMTAEEILSVFYENILYKKNDFGWQFKEDLKFFRGKILNYDLLDSKNGNVIWQYKMDAAGSCPPILYEVDGKQYLSIVSTGGFYEEYINKDSTIYTFALND